MHSAYVNSLAYFLLKHRAIYAVILKHRAYVLYYIIYIYAWCFNKK